MGCEWWKISADEGVFHGGSNGAGVLVNHAFALMAAARSGRVLNRLTEKQQADAGISMTDQLTYFSVMRDKANLAHPGKRQWRRVVSVGLANGECVGVVEVWEWPNLSEKITGEAVLAIQKAIHGKSPRYSDQTKGEGVGHIIASVLGFDVSNQRKLTNRIRVNVQKFG